jgi:UDP-glucose:glycoprotein glucosyltransferase
LLPSWFQPTTDAATNNQGDQVDLTDSTTTTDVMDPPSLWELVDPIVNRELQVSVVAHAWPTTVHNVLCEAWAHWNNDWSFGDGLVQVLQDNYFATNVAATNTPLDYKTARDLAIHASQTMMIMSTTSSSSSSTSSLLQLRLLQYALTMRAYSPQCELHRGLARQALLKTNQLSMFDGADRNAFVMVVPSGTILLDHDALQQYLLTRPSSTDHDDDEENNKSSLHDDDDDDALWKDFLLPGEMPHDGGHPQHGDSLIILYANLASPDFVTLYQALVQAHAPFVVRHLGHVHFEEERQLERASSSSSSTTSTSSSSSTVLQGYGVRLDIRNVEYKAFDDGGAKQEGADTGRLNVSSLEHVTPLVLAGVNLSAILPNQNDHTTTTTTTSLEKTLTWQQVLWELHESQQIQSQRIPPTWQRRQLPLQAATVIAAAANQSSTTTSLSQDPLITLTDLSQNLPSYVATLVQIRIPPAISKAAEAIEQVMRKRTSSSTALYINGLLVALDRPAWNVFELLSTIKKEQAKLQDIQSKLRPWCRNRQALRDVQRAWMQGEGFYEKSKEDGDDDNANNMDGGDDASQDEDGAGAGGGAVPATKVYRIDVGHGWKQAVIYVNDVEKDRQYSQWPRSLRQMLMSMQFGMPPMVRRNLFTILAVVDPWQKSSSSTAVVFLSSSTRCLVDQQ